MKNRIWGVLLGLLISLSAVSAQSGGWVWQNNGSTLTTSTPNNGSAVTIWNKNASGCTLTLKSGAAGTTVISVCGTTFTISGNFSLGTANCYGWSTDTFLERTAAGSVGVAATCGGAASGQIAVGTALFSGGQSLVGTSANVTKLQNGTTAQTLSVYATTAAAGNRVQIDGGASGVYRIISNWDSGGGVAFEFGAGGSNWRVPTAGHLLAIADNTYDIGASGATRPRIVYTATAVAIGATPATAGAIRIPNGTYLSARNVGNTADIDIIGVDSGNNVIIGDGDIAHVFPGKGNNVADFGASGTTWRTGYFGTSVVNALGTNAAPSYTFTGDIDTGIYSRTGDSLAMTFNGTAAIEFSSNSMEFGSGGILSWGSTTTPSSSGDLEVKRGGPGQIVFRKDSTHGALWEYSNDGIAQLLTRAGADTATVKANVFNGTGAFQSNGTPGVTCASAGTVSSTLGIVTACSAPDAAYALKTILPALTDAGYTVLRTADLDALMARMNALEQAVRSFGARN